MLYVVIVLGSVFIFMFKSLGDFLNAADQIDTMIAYLGVYALIVPLFMTIFRASGTLFLLSRFFQF